MWVKTSVMVIVAYLWGSIPSAYIMGRWVAGLDITQHGSGNVGGTNALRVLGLGPAVVVGLFDVSKGLLPTLLAKHIIGSAEEWPVLLVALAAVLGHNYSLWLRGRGGKGIATTVGVSLALFPWQLVVGLILGAVTVVAITRYVSLGSMLLITALPFALLLYGAPRSQVYFACLLAVLGLWRHRSNLQRLRQGTENRLGGAR